jgi:Cu-Zn family superoxide dismutase
MVAALAENEQDVCQARQWLAPILLVTLEPKANEEKAMNGKTPWHYAALLGGAALVVGCAPDPSERGTADGSRPGDSALSRNESGQPPAAGRDGGAGSIRPPTTTTSPAEPGGAVPPAASSLRLMARADVQPLNDGTARGIVEFQSPGNGALAVHVMLMGLDAGPHGMHIHEGTDCSAPGPHLNPQNAPHGAQNAAAAARHLGDLGNITADASGMVEEVLRDAQLGADSTFIGKVIVVHRGQDDLSTQPDGGSGDSIACGVIEAADDVISHGETLDRGV